jgi:O-antigen/teichoic acid export membrane protein
MQMEVTPPVALSESADVTPVGRVPGRFRNILMYGASRGVTECFLALRGLVLASLLGPEAFGGWALFRLATHYGGFAGLGVHRGMEFTVAGTGKADDCSEREPYWNTALSFAFVSFGFVALLSLAASFVVDSPDVAVGMRWFAGAILVEQVWLYGMTYLRAAGHLRRYAVSEALNAALNVVLAILFARLWALEGAFAAFVTATLLSLLLLSTRIGLRPRFSGSHLRRMIWVGLPILVTLMLGTAFVTADRLVVAAFGGTAMLGLYAFAVSIAGLGGSFAWVVRTVVYPEVYAEAGQGEAGTAMQDHLLRTIRPFARLFPPLLGILALAMPPLVDLLLPRYVDAIPAARLFIFTGVTTGFATLGTVGVVAIGRQRVLPLFSGGGLALNVTLSIAALQWGLGLEGVAAAALTSNTVKGLAVVGLLATASRIERKTRFLASVALPLLWCTMCVFVIGRMQTAFDVSASATSMGLFVLLLLPLLGVLRGEIRMLGRVRSPSDGTAVARNGG